MPSADSRSGGGSGKETGAASLEGNRGGWSMGRKLQPRRLTRRCISATAEKKGREGPGGPGSHCLQADPASGACPQRRCTCRGASWSPRQGVWRPPLGPYRTLGVPLTTVWFCPSFLPPTQAVLSKGSTHPTFSEAHLEQQLGASTASGRSEVPVTWRHQGR